MRDSLTHTLYTQACRHTHTHILQRLVRAVSKALHHHLLCECIQAILR